jgi:hypothetical protein
MPEEPSKVSQVVTTPPKRSATSKHPAEVGNAAGPSKRRLAAAFLVAAASDIISYWTELVPPVQWAVDLVTALLLFVILGWRWAILPGLVAEAMPGLAAFPMWVLVVASVAFWGGGNAARGLRKAVPARSMHPEWLAARRMQELKERRASFGDAVRK